MNPKREKAKKQILFGVILLLIVGGFYWFGRTPKQNITDFGNCIAAGNPVMESYPRQCKTSDGKTFKEDIGNELEKDDLIRISEPRPNTTITSPLIVKGMARGSWFFEASFPVRLIDGNGELLATGIAQANPPAGGDWMTSEFVPFEMTLSFSLSATTDGTLVLDKDNPLGLPEHDDALRVPVRFK